MSINDVQQETGISWSMIQLVLTKDLCKHSVCARWVPHLLTDDMKRARVTTSEVILREINGSVMVIDEKWLYQNPLSPLNNLRSWVNVADIRQRPQVPRRIISDIKYHVIVAINFRGKHYSEVLEPGETVNSERYILFLQHLIGTRRRGNLVIMHDNARPHKSRMTETFLMENNIHRVPQPPYSPDVNLLDRFVFRNMEAARSGLVIRSTQEARDFVDDFLRNIRRQSLTNELARLRDDLQEIINQNGDYLVK